MTHLLVAEFDTAKAMNTAAGKAANAGHPAQDALTPFPVPEVLEHLSYRPKRPVGWVIVIAGGLAAAAAWLTQWYSVTVAFPINSGNRPYNSWEVFFLVCFEVCILFGGIAGFITFVRDCRLPSLSHPLFEIAAIERASQDRFFLVFEASEDARRTLAELVADLKPMTMHEVAS